METAGTEDGRREWMRTCLGQGTLIANGLADQLGDAVLRLITTEYPANLPASLASGTGRTSAEAGAFLEIILAVERAHGGVVLIVEDELGKRGDPYLKDRQCCYVGDRVLGWRSLTSGELLEFIRRTSSGYPLNAYVVRASADELGLTDGAQLSDTQVASIVQAVTMFLCGALDSEGFVVAWRRD